MVMLFEVEREPLAVMVTMAPSGEPPGGTDG
jgi:hypothetical protein